MVTTRIISFHISSLSNFRLSILPSSVRCLIHCGISFSRVNSFRGTRIIHPSFAWIKQSIYICFRLSFFFTLHTSNHRRVRSTKDLFLSTPWNLWNLKFSFLSFVGVISFISFSLFSHLLFIIIDFNFELIKIKRFGKLCEPEEAFFEVRVSDDGVVKIVEEI